MYGQQQSNAYAGATSKSGYAGYSQQAQQGTSAGAQASGAASSSFGGLQGSNRSASPSAEDMYKSQVFIRPGTSFGCSFLSAFLVLLTDTFLGSTAAVTHSPPTPT